MKVATLKSLLISMAAFFLALSFPLQVLFSSRLPSLIPYLALFFLIGLTFFYRNKAETRSFGIEITSAIDVYVGFYCLLVLFQTSWQVLVGQMTELQAISSLVIYLFPVAFYLFFALRSSEEDTTAFLKAIAAVGFVIAIYFLYDTVLKLQYGEISDFQKRAFMYSVEQSGLPIEEASQFRIASRRSAGLLEKHAVSSAWSALGCFAALALTPRIAVVRRVIIMTIFGLCIIVGQNFTGIFSFLVVLMLFEFNVLSILSGKILRVDLKKILMIIAFGTSATTLFFSTIGSNMFEKVVEMVKFQFSLLFDNHEIKNYSYFGRMVFEDFFGYLQFVQKFPPSFLIGDGFSNYGIKEKGGDYGIIETFYRFGVPFFILLSFGIGKLLWRSRIYFKLFPMEKCTPASSGIWFATCTIMYVILADIHYSVWNTKSIFPVLMVSFAFMSKYLPKVKLKIFQKPSA